MSPLGLGVVGAGRFASFVADAVADLDDVRVRAVADPEEARARRLAQRHEARSGRSWQELLDDEAVDALVVATPPAGHAEIAVAGLEAGRHVFCEKPLAIDEAGAWRVTDAVARTGRVLVVDHVLRYNPLLRALQRLQTELLEPLQRFCLENDASDEDLDAGHWFWDPSRSGGILVEHGVHFFDAADMLAARAATSVQAVTARRADGRVDMVSATVAHGPAMLASHTHGFTHAHRCERQLMRLDFGTAEARVDGWIPVHVSVDLWTDEDGADRAEGLPGRLAFLMDVDGFRLDDRAGVQVAVERDAGPPRARGRGDDKRVPHHVRIDLTLGGAAAKPYAYAESVRAAMTDLAVCARTGNRPTSGAAEGAAAVALAVAATRSAEQGRRVELLPRADAHTPGRGDA
jgi:predicted dehydrogenase